MLSAASPDGALLAGTSGERLGSKPLLPALPLWLLLPMPAMGDPTADEDCPRLEGLRSTGLPNPPAPKLLPLLRRAGRGCT